MDNRNYLIIILVIIAIFMFMPGMEPFSNSGMNMHDEYCDRLSNVYSKCDECDRRVCDRSRRSTIDRPTGNYFTAAGNLL